MKTELVVGIHTVLIPSGLCAQCIFQSRSRLSLSPLCRAAQCTTSTRKDRTSVSFAPAEAHPLEEGEELCTVTKGR
jgi:hypothetical protein